MTFSSALVARQITGQKWSIVGGFDYYWNDLTIHVPDGYVTDFASVPRPFRFVIPKSGKYNQAAVLHDYIYTDMYKAFTKKQADLIFLDAMKDLGVSWWKRRIMYLSVQIFGKGNW